MSEDLEINREFVCVSVCGEEEGDEGRREDGEGAGGELLFPVGWICEGEINTTHVGHDGTGGGLSAAQQWLCATFLLFLCVFFSIYTLPKVFYSTIYLNCNFGFLWLWKQDNRDQTIIVSMFRFAVMLLLCSFFPHLFIIICCSFELYLKFQTIHWQKDKLKFNTFI